MLQQITGGSPPWPAAAVHDTVAAIMRQAPYQRSLSQSVWDRFIGWLFERIAGLIAGVRGLPSIRWVVLGLAIAAILLIAARVLYVRRTREDERTSWRRRARVSTEDPFALAERAAADGRYTEAAHALYRAVIETVARRERLRLHRSKTSGDYARELRRARSPSHGPFQAFGRRYDRIIYGDGRCDADGYAALLALAMPLLATARAA